MKVNNLDVIGGIAMTNSSTKKVVDKAVEYGGTVAGTAIGMGIGAVVAGPVGAVFGALGGKFVEDVFRWGGNEIKERCLSPAENRKITSVYVLAKENILRKNNEGRTLRSDGFFYAEIGDRSSAEEILEGIFFAAQRENEERKLPYLANLYANICFDDAISRPMANQLIKIAASISFRQLAILSIIGRNKELNLPFRDTAFQGFEDYNDMSIAADIFDLYRRSLIISRSAILDAASFTPTLLVMNGMGRLLYTYMELSSLPLDDMMQSIIDFLTNDSPIPSQKDIITGQIPTLTLEDIDEIVEKKTADIPRYEVVSEENSAGGQTLFIKDRRLDSEKNRCQTGEI